MHYEIKGGIPLCGDVEISGAKNAALGLIPAAIMTDEPVIIDNLPDVSDVKVLLEAIKKIGVKVKKIGRHKVEIDASKIKKTVVDNEHIRNIRAGYYLLGALLGRFHESTVALPGGCKIGERPIDIHIKGFRKLGADADVTSDMVHLVAKDFHAGNVFLDNISVGATINLMLAACLAPGKTVIENAAKEPHIVDVANMLVLMGAKIRGAGTNEIKIVGVEKLHGVEYSVIPDQIEAGTFMFAAAATGGNITVNNVIPQHMDTISSRLKDMGCEINEYDDSIEVIAPDRLKSCNIKTMPHPGFPTDMQPQATVALSVAKGVSNINETIFENRFLYLNDLKKMGANISFKPRSKTKIVIHGVEELKRATLNAPDLRAGAALVIAALVAKGKSKVKNIEFVQRGYEDFDRKLRRLGADIVCVEDTVKKK